MNLIKTTLIFLSLFFAFSLLAQEKNFIDQPYIEVVGYADTLLTPDEIYLNIRTSDKEFRDREAFNAFQDKMFDALKSIGIDVEKDLTIANIETDVRHYFFRTNTVKSESYTLKCSNAEILAKSIAKLEEIGVRNMVIDKVTHSQLSAIRDDLRAKATAHAKKLATKMTDAVGQHLGTAIYIKEGTENQNFSQNAAALLQGKMNSLRIRGMSSIKQTAGKMQVELEKISISQHILARFILRS